MMCLYHVTAHHIKWDCDSVTKKTLPESISYDIGLSDEDVDLNDNEDIEDVLADIVSDRISDDTGWCHGGFELDFKAVAN